MIGLYAHGMTVRDIQAHLLEINDVEVSGDVISRITDAVLVEVAVQQLVVHASQRLAATL